jgi:hypothetical protein
MIDVSVRLATVKMWLLRRGGMLDVSKRQSMMKRWLLNGVTMIVAAAELDSIISLQTWRICCQVMMTSFPKF